MPDNRLLLQKRQASSQSTDRPIRITRSKAANNITNHSTADEKVVASRKNRVNTNLGKTSLKNTGVSGKKRVKSENSGTSASGNKKVKSNMGAALVSGKKGVKRASTPPVNAKLTYAECSSDSTDTQSSPTQTPPRKMSSHMNALYPQTQTSPNSIPDCAWVPNQHVFAPVSSFQTADEVFGTTTFSPFKFTAGESGGVRGSKRKATPRKPFVFNFRQILDHYGNDEVPLPLQAEAVDHVTQTTDEPVDHVIQKTDHVTQTTDHVTEPVDHVIQKTDHVTEPVDHVIHSDLTISVDSLDCTLSSTVSTTPQITMATNTATNIVDNQNFVAIETEKLCHNHGNCTTCSN